jgi:DNA polymerase-3 subunit alpha
MLSNLEKIRQKSTAEQKRHADGQTSLFDSPGTDLTAKANFVKDELPEIEELAKNDLLTLEKNLLGLYLTEHPMEKALLALDNLVSHKIFELEPEELNGHKVKVGGIVVSLRKVFTKKGNNEMAFATIEDRTGILDLVVFPKLYAGVKNILVKDRVIVAEGKLDKRDDRISLIVDRLDEVKEN